MVDKVLRHKIDGTIYWWNPVLARNPKCEEIPYEVAFPEKQSPSATPSKANSPLANLRIPSSVLAEAEAIAEEEATPATPAELAREAARGLADELR